VRLLHLSSRYLFGAALLLAMTAALVSTAHIWRARAADVPQKLIIEPAADIGQAATGVVDLGVVDQHSPAGADGRFLVLPLDTPVDEAIKRFAKGEGAVLCAWDCALGTPPSERERKSLFVLLRYKTHNTGPVVLSDETIGCDLAAVWAGLASAPKQLVLIGKSGTSVGSAERRAFAPGWLSESMTPRFELPDTEGNDVTVLVRIDATSQFYNNFIFDHPTKLFEDLAHYRLRAGLLVGATGVAAVIALIGAGRRRSPDYLLLLGAIAAIAYWYVMRDYTVIGLDASAWRRLSLYAPPSIYFLFNAQALRRLSRAPGVDAPAVPTHKSLSLLQTLSLDAVVLVNAAYLGLSCLYAGIGIAAPGAMLLAPIINVAPFFSVMVLLGCAAQAYRQRTPGSGYMLAAQAIAAVGYSAMMLWSVMQELPSSAPENLMSLGICAVIGEATVWAIAVGRRYNYLDILAKGRIDQELARREAEVRNEIARTHAEKERLSVQLHGSYALLKETHETLINIVDTYAHAMSTLLSKTGNKIHAALRPRIAAEDSREALQVASTLLAQASSQLETLADSATLVLSKGGPATATTDLLAPRLAILVPELTKRGITVNVTVDPSVDGTRVPGFLLFETLQELLENVDRYAEPGGTVEISLTLDRRLLCVAIENTAKLREDDAGIVHGIRVMPARHTHNGQVSSGKGLAALRQLLENHGGQLAYERLPPDRFRMRASLPVRASAPA